jgi:HSF-type DNA-binding
MFLFHTIIHWDDHGRSFVITNMELFILQVIPFYFKGQTKASFFNHQMNRYAFRRLTPNHADPNVTTTFYHAMFLRGRRHLAFHIRQQYQRRKHRKMRVQDVSYDPATEPNFSMYPIVGATFAALPEPTLVNTQTHYPVRESMLLNTTTSLQKSKQGDMFPSTSGTSNTVKEVDKGWATTTTKTNDEIENASSSATSGTEMVEFLEDFDL